MKEMIERVEEGDRESDRERDGDIESSETVRDFSEEIKMLHKPWELKGIRQRQTDRMKDRDPAVTRGQQDRDEKNDISVIIYSLEMLSGMSKQLLSIQQRHIVTEGLSSFKITLNHHKSIVNVVMMLHALYIMFRDL